MSAFTLGTVQLGMDYGIAGKTDKPTEEYAHSVLDAARSVGVNILDTANNYGDSERVIGSWLKTLDEKDRPMIVTKIGPFKCTDEATIRQKFFEQTEKCLETLGVDCIDILMLHNYEDYTSNPEVVRDCMRILKESGKIKLSAVSVYSYNDYEVIADSGLDAVQIPLNVFDWGKIDDGGIRKIADSGMMIFVRSVFLQGIVFLDPEALDPQMNFAKPYLCRFHEIARELEMTPDVLAASFVMSVPGVTSLVLGCQTPEQVTSNAKLVDGIRKLTTEEMEKLHEAFRDIDPRVINPRLWYNHT